MFLIVSSGRVHRQKPYFKRFFCAPRGFDRTSKICAFRPLALCFRFERVAVFVGFCPFALAIIRAYCPFNRTFPGANGSFSIERMNESALLRAFCASWRVLVVMWETVGFPHRGALLRSEKLYKIGILEASADLCACGNFRPSLVGKPLFNMARPGIIQNSKVILFNFSRHGPRPKYSRRGTWARDRSAREHPAGKNTTRGERTATAEARISNTVALAERSEALRRANVHSLPAQINKRSGACARCAQARGARLSK